MAGKDKGKSKKGKGQSKRTVKKYADDLRSYATTTTNAIEEPRHDMETEQVGRRKRKRPEPLLPPSAEGEATRLANSTYQQPATHQPTQNPGPATVLGHGSRSAPKDVASSAIRDAMPDMNEIQDSEMRDDDGSDNGDDESSDNEDDQHNQITIAKTMKKIEEIHKDDGGKVTVESLVTLLRQVLNMKSAEEERKHPGSSKGKSKPVNPANDPTVKWDQNKPHTIRYEVKHRDAERNALLASIIVAYIMAILTECFKGYIRYLMYDKLGREGPGDPLPPSAPPEIMAPTPRAFYLRWDESESSLFNQTAARIIADQVIADWPGIHRFTDFDDLQGMVTMHIVYLKACWLRQNDPNAESKEARRLRRCSVDTRKRTLYAHRIAVIDKLPGLEKHARLIEALGLEGTSSDEEDPVTGIYIIHRKSQLAPEVQHLKEQIDQAYMVNFKGPGSRGNQVRTRVDRGVISKRPFTVKGLPESCLNPGWVMNLTELQKEMFQIVLEPAQYDYSFPKELLEVPTY